MRLWQVFLAVKGQEPEPGAFGASTVVIVGSSHGDGALREPEARPCERPSSGEKQAKGDAAPNTQGK